jgi:hypothetical protein
MMIMQQTINSMQEEEKGAAVANRDQTETRSETPPPHLLTSSFTSPRSKRTPLSDPGWAYSLSVERIVGNAPLSSCVYRIFLSVRVVDLA